MKQLFFIIKILCFAYLLNAQQLTIGGIEGQTLFLGISNKIEYNHPDYSIVKMEFVNNNCRFRNNTCYCSKEGNTTLLISDTLNNFIDSFAFTVKQTEVFGVFIKLKDGSLIKPTRYISKQRIQQFQSLYCANNVPWVNLKVDAFDFTLLQNGEVFSFTIQKNMLPSEVRFLLTQIGKGAKIYIDNLKIRMPGDDGMRVIQTFDLNVN